MCDMQRTTHSDEILDLVAPSLLHIHLTCQLFQFAVIDVIEGFSSCEKRHTLSLAAVLGSMTCLRSRESALTLLPTSPACRTNDLGLPSPVGFAVSAFCVRFLPCRVCEISVYDKQNSAEHPTHATCHCRVCLMSKCKLQCCSNATCRFDNYCWSLQRQSRKDSSRRRSQVFASSLTSTTLQAGIARLVKTRLSTACGSCIPALATTVHTASIKQLQPPKLSEATQWVKMDPSLRPTRAKAEQ